MELTDSGGRRLIRRLAAAGGISLAGLAVLGHPARADGAPPAVVTGAPGDPAGAPLSWAEAVSQTRDRGIPTVLVVTSRSVPASSDVARAVLASPAAARLAGAVHLATFCVEDEPEQAQRLMVTRFPTFVGLRRGADGSLALAGVRRGAMSGEELTGWVWGIGLAEPPDASASPAGGDAGVVKAGLFHGRSAPAPAPSPQSPSPPPTKSVPVSPPPAPPREVVVERPVERQVIVEREVPVEREVVVERAPVRTRNVLTRPVREREVVREVVVERAAPEEVVREVVVTPTRAVEVADEAQPLTLIPAHLPGRAIGWIGEKLRVAGLPRLDVTIERETHVRPVAPRHPTVFLAQPAPRTCTVELAPRDTYTAPAPTYSPPQNQATYAASPQSR